jgi:hypothetical protein
MDDPPDAGQAAARAEATWFTGRLFWSSALLYGFFLCLFLAFFHHGDLLYNAFVSNHVALGHIDVYDYFSNTPRLRGVDTVMPPFYYLLTGGYLKVLDLLHLDPVTTVIRGGVWSARTDLLGVLFGHKTGLPFYFGTVLLKLPNVAALAVGAELMRRLTSKLAVARTVAIVIWLASPALIVTGLMQAQNDILAAAVTIGALLAFSNGWSVRGMLLLGVAASLKNYALILVPVTALLLSRRSPGLAVKLLVAGVLPELLTTLPFLDHALLTRVFHAHDSSTALGGVHVGGWHVPLWALVYAAVLGYAWTLAKRSVDAIDVAALWTLSLLSLFILSWWRPQWVVWIVPMAAILAGLDRQFLRCWVAANVAILLNNFVMLPGNMDGAMLFPVLGTRRGSMAADIVLYSRLLPPWAGIVTRGLCIACFTYLALRSLRWLAARDAVASLGSRVWLSSKAAVAEAMMVPAWMIPCVAAMIVQHAG